jgi:hypothetical protein
MRERTPTHSRHPTARGGPSLLPLPQRLPFGSPPRTTRVPGLRPFCFLCPTHSGRSQSGRKRQPPSRVINSGFCLAAVRKPLQPARRVLLLLPSPSVFDFVKSASLQPAAARSTAAAVPQELPTAVVAAAAAAMFAWCHPMIEVIYSTGLCSASVLVSTPTPTPAAACCR